MALRTWYVEHETRIRRDYRFDDISYAHAIVFENLGRDGARVSEIARRATVSKQAVAQMVDYLEARGYVERTMDPRDGRAKIVQLTSSGRRAASAAKRVMVDLEEELQTRMGADRMNQLRGALEDLISRGALEDLFRILS